MKKRILSSLLAAMMVAMLATSCGSSNSDTKTDDTKTSTAAKEDKKTDASLTIWMPPYGTEDSSDKAFWERELAPLDAKVSLEVVPWGDYETKYLTGITSGEGPDVGYMYNEMLADFINMGALEPLDEYLTQEEKDRYIYIDKGVINDKQYTIPMVVGNARVLFCNMDILNAAGITAPPKTWDEFGTTAQAIKDTVPDKDPVLFGWADPAIGALNTSFYPLLWQNGGEIFDKDGKLSVATPEGIEAAQFLLDMKTKGWMPDKATSLKGDEVKTAFINGEVGMWITGSSDAKQIEDGGKVKNWDFTSSLTKKNQGTFIAADALVLISASKNKELAAEAMKLMTSASVMEKFHTELSSFPPIGTDEAYKDNEKFKDLYTNETDTLHTLPVVAGSFKVYDTLYKNLQLMMQGEMTPEEALKDAETASETLLKK